MPLENASVSELLARAAEEESEHRERALRRAARAALHWPVEAATLLEEGRSLTELRNVGPWIARRLEGWLTGPEAAEPPEPPEVRRGFLSLSEVRATLAEDDRLAAAIRADLQMHTTYSDGKASLEAMAAATRALGYEHVAITDHSVGLPIAHGMSEERLAAEGRAIDELNDRVAAGGSPSRLLRAIEMNLSPEGEGDMSPAVLARLDLVLGAFHSKLRVPEDQTERYLAALRNPTVDVLAHPRGRRWNVRTGLHADWPRVAAEAAERGIALEIDAFPDRQDLDVATLGIVRDAGGWVSIGTDAHHPAELRYLQFGLAAAIRAGIPSDRILNTLSRQELAEWVAARRERANARP